jgi:hypothetical protein
VMKSSDRSSTLLKYESSWGAIFAEDSARYM